MKRITGWLCPDGKFVQCEMYEHIDFCKKHPIFTQRVPKIVEILDRLDSIEEGCRELAEREGNSNAEWHCYEIASDNARPEIRRLLLNDGFIRVGESEGSLHFEGRPNVLKSKHQACKDLADSYGTDAVFEPQR